MIARLFITSAVLGMCSEILTPEALVLISLNGPPVILPGLRSQMSIVAGPPAIHRMITLLLFFFSSWALACSARTNWTPGTARAEYAAACLRKCRRFTPLAMSSPAFRGRCVEETSGVGVGAQVRRAKE